MVRGISLECWRGLWLLGLCCVGAHALAEDPAPPPKYPEHQDLMYTLDARGTQRPVENLVDWQTRRGHILGNMQLVMGAVPDASRKVPLQVQQLEEVPVGKLVRRKLAYSTEATDRVTAYLFLPPLAEGTKAPAILCLHQTTKIGKEEPAGMGGNPNLHYALHLAERGYVTLAPDYPSFGEHGYDFDPRHGYQSGTMKAIWDNMRAVDLLQSLPQVDPERIGCIGHSLGGHNTMFTAAFDPRIKVLVSNCGFTRFHKYYGGKLAGWTSNRYMPLIAKNYGNDPDQVPFDFTEIVGLFAPRPFLASAPVRDSNFEVSGVRDVIEAAKSVYALYGKTHHLQANYPESEHDFPESARDVAYDFFDQHLRRE